MESLHVSSASSQSSVRSASSLARRSVQKRGRAAASARGGPSSPQPSTSHQSEHISQESAKIHEAATKLDDILDNLQTDHLEPFMQLVTSVMRRMDSTIEVHNRICTTTIGMILEFMNSWPHKVRIFAGLTLYSFVILIVKWSCSCPSIN